MFVRYNENPCNKRTIDCTVRALSTLLDEDWNKIYIQLCVLGYEVCDMPSSKSTVNRFLSSKGFKRFLTPEDSGEYTVSDFTHDYPEGRYLLATDSHVVPVIDGDYIDTWDSGREIPLFFWRK